MTARGITAEDLANRFTYHAPTPEAIPKFGTLRAAAHDLASLVNELAPDGREKSLAITAIEEAVMWANAAIARDLPAAPDLIERDCPSDQPHRAHPWGPDDQRPTWQCGGRGAAAGSA